MLALAALVIALIAALAGLAQLKFTSFLADSVEERLEIVAATSAQDFTSAIDLGLSLGEVANGEAILRRASGHDPNIEAIHVFDTEGTILHSFGGGEGGTIDPETQEAYRLASSGITEPRWGIETGGHISTGVVLEGSFGRPIGGIVVEYPTTEMAQQAGVMTRRLLVNGAIVGLVMVAAVLGVLRVFQRRLPGLGSA